MRVESTMSECAPEASSHPTPPSGSSERSTLMRGSFEHLDAVAQISGELELLALDRATQTVLQFPQHGRALERLRHRRAIRASDMPMIPVDTPQQLADSCFEIRVTPRTSPSTRSAEV